MANANDDKRKSDMILEPTMKSSNMISATQQAKMQVAKD